MSNKLFLILTSGSREKLQMAGMMAAVAAVSDTEVSVFLSMNALCHFINGRNTPFTVEGEMGKLMAEKHAPNPIDLFKQAVAGNPFPRPFYGGTATPIKPFVRVRQASVLRQLQALGGF